MPWPVKGWLCAALVIDAAAWRGVGGRVRSTMRMAFARDVLGQAMHTRQAEQDAARRLIDQPRATPARDSAARAMAYHRWSIHRHPPSEETNP